MRLIITMLIASVFGACAVAGSGYAKPKPSSAPQKSWVETCEKWDEWDKPGPAFQIYANTYYVGTCGISAILITGSEGHILIDGGTAKGAPIIANNIASLGFDIADIEILLHSHEHFDHVAGLAELQLMSGARLYASVAAEPVLATGETASSDPQFGMHDPFPAATVSKTVVDGDIVRLGDLALTAIATPGHTQGALSWQWQSCESEKCQWIVYADSLSPISRDDYKFSDHVEYVMAFREGLEKLKSIDCTLLVTPHPSASQMRDRLAASQLSNPKACVEYANSINDRLNKRLEKEATEN